MYIERLSYWTDVVRVAESQIEGQKVFILHQASSCGGVKGCYKVLDISSPTTSSKAQLYLVNPIESTSETPSPDLLDTDHNPAKVYIVSPFFKSSKTPS